MDLPWSAAATAANAQSYRDFDANGYAHGYPYSNCHAAANHHADREPDVDGYGHSHAFANSVNAGEHVDTKTYVDAEARDIDSTPDEDTNTVGKPDSHIGGGDSYPYTGRVHPTHGTGSDQKHRFARRSYSVPHCFAGFRRRLFGRRVGWRVTTDLDSSLGSGRLDGYRWNKMGKLWSGQRGGGKVKIDRTRHVVSALKLA